MPLRNTIYVPVFDKNLSVFVSGVLERRRDGRMMLLIDFHLGGFRRKRTKAVSAKNEQLSHDDISTCSQCRGFSVRQRICYDKKMSLP
jgi:hypothetical protein